MSSLKSIKQAQKVAAQQEQVVLELQALVRDIERSETIIVDLKAELEAVNERYKDRKTTRDEVAYLSDLLRCATKKLAWEKQIASIQKRAPAILDRLVELIEDPQNPPTEEMRTAMVKTLQGVQTAMERLQQVKVG